ncbi:MAG: TetR/AcrR family transcriptional regulator, partial [Pseudomonadota bacterium]
MRKRVLTAASRQINQQGAAAIDLKELGQQVGLSRNSLYHYFDNRQDLAYQCYLQSARNIQEDLESAFEDHDQAPQRMTDFLHKALVCRTDEQPALSDLENLTTTQRRSVLRVRNSNLAAMEVLFADGVKRGDLRTHRTEISARSLYAMVDWARLWHRWTEQVNTKKARQLRQISTGIACGLLGGIASKKYDIKEQRLTLQDVIVNEIDLFDSSSVREHKRLQIIGATSRIFNRKGIFGTSIDDVTTELGATKGTIYHYFNDKDQLVLACRQRAIDLYELFLEAGERCGKGTVQSMITSLHLNCLAQASSSPPLILQATLPSREMIRTTSLSRRVKRNITTAIRRGECRPESKLLVDLAPGAFFWFQKWIAENKCAAIGNIA